MNRGPNFIKWEVFQDTMEEVARQNGAPYEDIKTVYGDMSRLVVAFLACTPPEKLRAMYNDLGWEGGGNARAFHAAAKAWLEKHHPGRCPVTSD